MLGIDLILNLFILLTALFSIVMALVLAIHVWLRATVGKFQSNESMNGKTVLITGGNSGLGLETVRDLAKRGAHIIMASRKTDVGNKVRDEIIRETGNKNISVRKLDLSSFESVREFASDILRNEKKIDVLINNSGCASTFNKRQSVDGLELTMATNHYGPFLLTHLLFDLLKKSSARIVIVSSAYYMTARVDLKNLNPLDVFPFYLYYVTKTANIMFGLELAKRLKGTACDVYLVNPGMCNTAIFKKVPFPLNVFVKHSFKSPKEGAQTIIMCSVLSSLAGVSGKYFSDCRETGLLNFVKDDVNNKTLWDESVRITKLKASDPQIQ